MIMNLTFNYPFEISPDVHQDKLVVLIKESQSLLTCLSNGNRTKNNRKLSEISYTMTITIPKQLPLDDAT